MSVFLMLMIAGLVGLVLMALPGMARHGHAGTAHGIGGHVAHGGLRLHAGPRGAGQIARGHAPANVGRLSARAARAGGHGKEGISTAGFSAARLIPSPRTVFSLLTLYGAFGNAFVQAGHMPPKLAAILAIVPAALLERLVITPLWNLLFRFQGTPSSELTTLVLQEAEAVTPFRNGRGLVSVERDGRIVQFRAELAAEQARMPVRVGDKLTIESVDPTNERVTVAVK